MMNKQNFQIILNNYHNFVNPDFNYKNQMLKKAYNNNS